MVSQRNLVASQFLCRVMERTPAHPGAKAAWAGLLPHIKHNFPNLGTLDQVLRAHPPAKLLNRGIIAELAAEAGIQRNSNHLIVNPNKPFQLKQALEQRYRVLSPGYADGNPIPVLNHVKFLYCLPHIAKETLHR